jgi:hypothetical protein
MDKLKLPTQTDVLRRGDKGTCKVYGHYFSDASMRKYSSSVRVRSCVRCGEREFFTVLVHPYVPEIRISKGDAT